MSMSDRVMKKWGEVVARLTEYTITLQKAIDHTSRLVPQGSPEFMRYYEDGDAQFKASPFCNLPPLRHKAQFFHEVDKFLATKPPSNKHAEWVFRVQVCSAAIQFIHVRELVSVNESVRGTINNLVSEGMLAELLGPGNSPPNQDLLRGPSLIGTAFDDVDPETHTMTTYEIVDHCVSQMEGPYFVTQYTGPGQKVLRRNFPVDVVEDIIRKAQRN